MIRLLRLIALNWRANLLPTLCALAIVKSPLLQWYRDRLLCTWQVPERRNWLDNLFYNHVVQHWFRLDYYTTEDPDERETKKALLMGGESGREWAKRYDSSPLGFTQNVGRLTGAEALPVFSALMEAIDDSGPLTVVQVGSGSGREIAWVARQFRDVRCIGFDMYPEIIDYSRQAHREANLEFCVLDAKSIGRLLPELQGRVIVFSSGSLQYVQPEHLGLFFRAIAAKPDCEIVLTEPVGLSGGDPTRMLQSGPRGGFSYTHNYRFMGECHGLHERGFRIILPYGPPDPDHGTVGHYFYYGSSRARRSAG